MGAPLALALQSRRAAQRSLHPRASRSTGGIESLAFHSSGGPGSAEPPVACSMGVPRQPNATVVMRTATELELRITVSARLPWRAIRRDSARAPGPLGLFGTCTAP